MCKISSYRDALRDALFHQCEKYPSMIVLTSDLGKAVRIHDLKTAFPNRYYSIGISEANMVSMAAGLATTGLVPVIAGFAMFVMEKPFEQIRNSIAYPNLNVKIVATHGGLAAGMDGATHQALEDIAIARTLPNFTVLVPSDIKQTEAAIAIAMEHVGPVYVRLGRDEAREVYESDCEMKIGGSDILREGKDITIIACGMMVYKALKAAKELSEQGIDAEIINAYSIKPLDKNSILQSVKKTGGILTVEDHSIFGGLGSAVAELLVKEYPAPMEMLAVQDMFGESGSAEELFDKYGLSVNSINSAAKQVIKRKKLNGQ